MLIWSQGAFVSALALSLLHSLWQGALLGLLGLALNVRLKRAAPDVRCGAFFLLLLTIFAVWLGTFCCVYEAQTRPSVLSVGMSAGASSHELLTVASADNGVSRAISLLQSISPLLVASWALGVCALAATPRRIHAAAASVSHGDNAVSAGLGGLCGAASGPNGDKAEDHLALFAPHRRPVRVRPAQILDPAAAQCHDEA
jgi:hypothetical protein